MIFNVYYIAFCFVYPTESFLASIHVISQCVISSSFDLTVNTEFESTIVFLTVHEVMQSCS